MDQEKYLGSERNKQDKARWQREWRKNNPEKVRQIWDKWEEFSGYIQSGKAHLKRNFKITEEIYQAILKHQDYVCAVCKNPETEKDKFVPDHDHSCCSGRSSCGRCVRGLLHRTCNSGLGLLKDSPNILIQAADYLRNNLYKKE